MALLTQTGLRSNRYCSMADFPFFKMAAVRHLEFLKLEILTSGPVRKPNVRHVADIFTDQIHVFLMSFNQNSIALLFID